MTIAAQGAICPAMAANFGRLMADGRATAAAGLQRETYAAEDSIGFLIAATRTRCSGRSMWNSETRFHRGAVANPARGRRRCDADRGRPVPQAELRHGLDDADAERWKRRASSCVSRRTDDRRIVRLRMTAAGRGLYPRLRDATIRVLNQSRRRLLGNEESQTHEQTARDDSTWTTSMTSDV